MRYRFADLELDLDQRRLSREGNNIELSKLTFDVLATLVEAAPDLVTHDQLVDSAWGENRVVTPENLYQRITVLRKALGDDAQDPAYIESVRGTGFRLIPAVGPAELPSQSHRHTRLWAWGAASLAVLLLVGYLVLGRLDLPGGNAEPIADPGTGEPDAPQTVAVLPFQNFSPDAENQFYALGIHEEVLNQLAKLRQLRVTSRTSVGRYADTQMSLPDIAEELGVDALIEGSVRYADDRIRVTVQLVDGATDEHLWSDTYDHPVGDIFWIESDIATQVADALRLTYVDDERLQLENAPTASSEAYIDYLRGQGALSGQYFESGKQFMRSAEPKDALPYALKQFERAVEADPEFALAHAVLSQVHIDLYWYGVDRSDERRQKALAAAQRARELQPDLPEARLAMAYYLYHGYLDYGAALQELDGVRDQLPSSAEIHRIYSAIYRRQGRWDLSLQHGERALELDPFNVETLWSHSATCLAMRRYDTARELINRAIALAPDTGNPYEMLAYIGLMDRGDTAAGVALAEAAPEAIGSDVDKMYWAHALYSRDYEGALELLDRRDQFAFPNAPFLYPRESLRALIYRLQGKDDLAQAHFELARAQIETALEEQPFTRSTPNLRVMLGEALVGLGEVERGIASVERGLFELSPEVDAYFGRILQYEAIMRIYLQVDPFGRALPLLDEYLSVHGGGFSIEGMLPDPRLDPIRDDPRFQALVEKHRR